MPIGGSDPPKQIQGPLSLLPRDNNLKPLLLQLIGIAFDSVVPVRLTQFVQCPGSVYS